MKNVYVRLGVSILVLVLLAASIGYIATNDLKLFGFEIRSFKGYSDTLAALTGTENKFETASETQKTKLQDLENAKKSFEKEKKEYEAISEETIANIKEVTKKEKYSLEYLWIRMGQYAKKYKVQVSLIEPGGNVVEQTQQEGKPQEQQTSGETTTTTPQDSTTEQQPTQGEQQAPQGEQQTTQNGAPTSNYRIDAIGDYDKIADFVYAIETDDTLRFKLDNINMQPSGSQVRAIFEIKNLEIIK